MGKMISPNLGCLEFRDYSIFNYKGIYIMEKSTIRELSSEEIQQVNGGVLPLVGLALSAAGHFMARSLAGSLISRASLAVGVAGGAAYFKDK